MRRALAVLGVRIAPFAVVGGCLAVLAPRAAGTASPPRPVPSVPALVDSIRNLTTRGRLVEADSLGRQGLADMAAAPGADSIAIADVLDVTVEAMRRRLGGVPADAPAFAERAVRLRDRGPAADSLKLAGALTNLGRIRRLKGDLDAAGECFDRALAIRRAKLAADDPEIAVSLTSLGLLRRDQGRMNDARRLLESALVLRESKLGPNHPEVAFALNNLALILQRQGDFGAAVGYLQRAVRILESQPRVDSLRLATACESYASSLIHIGDWREGLVACRRSLEITNRLPGFGAGNAGSLENLGVLLGMADSAAAGVVALRRSRELFAANSGSSPLALARNLWNLGKGEMHAGMNDSAEVHMKLAQERFRTMGGGNQRYAGEIDGDLGALDIARGDLVRAEAHMRASLDATRAEVSPDHPNVPRALYDLAWCRFALGDSAGLADTLMLADRLFEATVDLNMAGLSQEHALAYALRWRVALDRLLSTLEEWPGSTSVAAVWDRVIHGRGAALDEMALRRRLVAAVQDSSTRAAVIERAEACRELSTLAFGPPDAEAQARAIARRQLAEEVLASRLRGFRAATVGRAAGYEPIAAALGDGDALVAYVRYGRTRPAWHHDAMARALARGEPVGRANDQVSRPYYLAFVLPGRGAAPRMVPIGEAAPIDSTIRAWRDAMSALAGSPGRARIAKARRIGLSIRTRIWDPVAALCPGAGRILVVPDGDLALVQPEALPAAAGRYLIEGAVEIRMLTGERDVLPATGVGFAAGLLAIGGVDYESSEALAASIAVAQPGPELSRGAPLRGRPGDCDEFGASRYMPLPFSLAEVRRIGAMWKAPAAAGGSRGEVVEMTGGLATEAAFKRLAGDFGTIHVATHGFFVDPRCEEGPAKRAHAGTSQAFGELGDANPLLRSGLVFAGANRRKGAPAQLEDGILTAEEIAVLDLSRVGLVVLSACHSGAGEGLTGEGVQGLRRSFEIAGVGSLVTSLWEVNDAASRRWMELFYRSRLAGETDLQSAARKASLAMLGEQRKHGAVDPGAWGGFLATGR